MLETRTDARADYKALEEQGGEWAVPWGVRRALGLWTFSKVTDQIDLAKGVLASRDALAEAAAAIDVEPLADYETQYQDAVDLAETDIVEQMGR